MSDISSFDPSGAFSGLSDNGTTAGGSSFNPSSVAGAGLSAFGDLTSAAGGFIGSQANAAAARAEASGFTAESQAYSKAAGYAQGNVSLENEATAIQQYQQQRQLQSVLGQQKAIEGASGLSGGGSGLYLLRSSMAQGALAKGLIGVQGAVNAAGYAEQSAAYTGTAQQSAANASAAESAASSASTGGFLDVLGGVAKVASLALPFL